MSDRVRKRRLQFGLRLLVALVLCAGLGASLLRRYQAYRALDAIASRAVHVRPQPRASGWQRLFSNDVYRIHHLSFHGAFGITDDVAQAVSRLRGLRRLSFHGTAVGNLAARHVANLTELEALSFQDTNLNDAGMVHLAGLAKLTSLSLNHLSLTDDGMQHLVDLRAMETLLLNGNCITTLEHFHKMHGLKRLELSYGGEVQRGSLRFLQPMRQLETLHIQSIPATDADLKHLAGAHALKSLVLAKSQLVDSPTATWQAFRQLERLYVDNYGDIAIADHDALRFVWLEGQPESVTFERLPNLDEFRVAPARMGCRLRVANCPKLRVVDVLHAQAAILEDLADLRALSLYPCERLRLEGLPKLTWVRLHGCDVSTELVKELAESGGKIKNLWFGGSRFTDVAAIEQLAQLADLEELNFRSSSAGRESTPLPDVQRQALLLTLKRLPRLRDVSIPNAWTDEQFIDGLLELSTLEKIDLRAHDLELEVGLQLLELPKLQRLFLYFTHTNGRIEERSFTAVPRHAIFQDTRDVRTVAGRTFLIE